MNLGKEAPTKLKRNIFCQPRNDYIQESISQYAIDKDALCKVSEYEISQLSKYNLPKLSQANGQQQVIYWLHRNHPTDTTKSKVKSDKMITVLYPPQSTPKDFSDVQLAREKAGSILGRIYCKRILHRLQEIYFKTSPPDIEIRETCNSYLNLKNMEIENFNHNLSSDTYDNFLLNVENKNKLLKNSSTQKTNTVHIPNTVIESKQMQMRRFRKRYFIDSGLYSDLLYNKDMINSLVLKSQQEKIMARYPLNDKERREVFERGKHLIKEHETKNLADIRKQNLKKYFNTISQSELYEPERLEVSRVLNLPILTDESESCGYARKVNSLSSLNTEIGSEILDDLDDDLLLLSRSPTVKPITSRFQYELSKISEWEMENKVWPDKQCNVNVKKNECKENNESMCATSNQSSKKCEIENQTTAIHTQCSYNKHIPTKCFIKNQYNKTYLEENCLQSNNRFEEKMPPRNIILKINARSRGHSLSHKDRRI